MVVVVVVIKHFGDDLNLDFPKITVSEKFAVMPDLHKMESNVLF